MTDERARGPILVVDDDADVREAMTIALESQGYEVMTAVDGVDCLRRLRGPDRPRLVLLDLMMPVMNGWEVCAELEHDPDLATIPVIVLTGNVSERPPELATSGFLRKPVALSTLVEAIERHLGG